MSEESNGSVRFSTKELLAALDAKLDRILDKLDQKADKSAVVSLETRVTTIERQGSPGLEELRARVHKMSGTVAGLEKTLVAREHLDVEQAVHTAEIEALKTWRNRIVGALSVISLSLGTVAAIVLHYL